MGSRVCIICDSRNGSTLDLAEAIEAGVQDEQGESRLRRVGFAEPEHGVDPESAAYQNCHRRLSELHHACMEDLRWADGIVWGSPTRYGLISLPLSAFIDDIAPLWREGALIGKVGAAFTSTGGMHSGNETTLWSLLMPFLQHGMIIMGVPHSVPELVWTNKGGSPYGATAVTGFDGRWPTDSNEIAIARALGARVARVASQIEAEPGSVELAAFPGNEG